MKTFVRICISYNKNAFYLISLFCYIDESLPISHLATFIYAKNNKDKIKIEPALTKDQVQKNKIDVYIQVAKTCDKVVATLMANKDQKMRDVNKVHHYETYR